MPFFIQIATQQSEAQLMAECPMCGAITFAPLVYPWAARSVVCSECGVKTPMGPHGLAKLKAAGCGRGFRNGAAVDKIEALGCSAVKSS